MQQDPHLWIAALRESHDSLVNQVRMLSPDQLTSPSYCRDWDVSQVLSHIGSGAEIGLLGLERTLDGRAPLDRAEFPTIWARWNGEAPQERAEEVIVWDRRAISVWQGLDDATLAELTMDFIGMKLDAVGMVGLRLGEHALHAWDVAVSFDDQAELGSDAAGLLVDRIGWIAGRTGKSGALPAPRRLSVVTSAPERNFVLDIAEKVSLEPAEGKGEADGTTGSIWLPAAALIRLVYGRLDPAHTPLAVKTDGDANLDELRMVFPGF